MSRRAASPASSWAGASLAFHIHGGVEFEFDEEEFEFDEVFDEAADGVRPGVLTFPFDKLVFCRLFPSVEPIVGLNVVSDELSSSCPPALAGVPVLSGGFKPVLLDARREVLAMALEFVEDVFAELDMPLPSALLTLSVTRFLLPEL
ncbi:MAG TPA: hypothetical protein VGC91_17640 [Pyrinomonadaceae bacterium]|jgi:hypothetical protein